MKSNAFGLDIGTTSVKVVWLNREKNMYEYNTALFTPSLPQGMMSESPMDKQEMAQLINKLVIDAKITINNVNVALPESRVFTKVIDMPVISDKELSGAIYWEAEQYIPASLDTMSLDYSVLRRPTSTSADPRMQVLLVAAPLQLIKRYQSILDTAGLSIVSIETEILSIIRGIVGNNNFPTSLIINIGAFSSSMCIIQNNILVFTYSITLGGVAMTRAIASDFGFSPQQAEEYKKVYGLHDKNIGGKIRKAIEPILITMISEVKKAIAFYNDKYKNEKPISQILLSGGGAGLPGLDLYFAGNLGIETVITDSWKMLSIQKVPKEIELSGPEFTLAIGLALKEYE